MNNQRGSVFFYILIGVALFASLSYAVSQSVRLSKDSEGSSIGDSERNKTLIVDIQQFLEAVTFKVYEATNLNGVPEGSLDFRNDVYVRANGGAIFNNQNSNCSESKCRIFAPYGDSGIKPIIFQSAATSPEQTSNLLPKNGHLRIRVITLEGVGSPAPDLVLNIHGIKSQVCNLYNKSQDIVTAYDSTTSMTSIGEGSPSSVPDDFNGTFTTSRNFGTVAIQFVGKRSFCAPAYIDAASNRLAIWHVVKAR